MIGSREDRGERRRKGTTVRRSAADVARMMHFTQQNGLGPEETEREQYTGCIVPTAAGRAADVLDGVSDTHLSAGLSSWCADGYCAGGQVGLHPDGRKRDRGAGHVAVQPKTLASYRRE